MSKQIEALKLAEALYSDTKDHREVSYGLDCPPEHTANWQHALNCEAAAKFIRETLPEHVKQEPVTWMNTNGAVNNLRESGWAVNSAPVDIKAILEMRDKAFQSYVDQVKVDRELSVLQARMEAFEEAAKRSEAYAYMSDNFNVLAEEIRGMK